MKTAHPRRGLGRGLERIAVRASRWSGSSGAFTIAAGIVVFWLASGPIFGFSDTWQLVINTGTTIITFLMVFLIQRSQNKDAMAMQLKLNEIVAAVEGASNRLIDVEDLSEEELQVLHRHFRALVEKARSEASLTRSHSVEDAEQRHRHKQQRHRAVDKPRGARTRAQVRVGS
jgi:low affinity Fe/Cu permease